MFFPKDFIETAEGLIFAVVERGTENDKVLCFLRYVKEVSGWRKYSTDSANVFLKRHYPDYLHYSEVLDAYLHAVAVVKIVRHHRPKQRLQEIMQAKPKDGVERDVIQLCRLFQQAGVDLSKIGTTGSILVGVQNPASDIDLVCYDKEIFHQCRAVARLLIDQAQLQNLNDGDWLQSYDRRSCALTFAEYVWHERRKYNKAVINGRKFDLNLLAESPPAEKTRYRKQGFTTLQCRIANDAQAFDFPSEFLLEHESVRSVVSFTATYTGQAFRGETVEVAGIVEQTEQGDRRIVVGSSREAHGEYIKVIDAVE